MRQTSCAPPRLRPRCLAVLCFGLLRALQAAPLDFSFPNEPAEEDRTEVVKGNITVKIEISWYNIAAFSVSIKNTLQGVGVVATPVVMNTYQFMSNFGANRAELHIRYHVLPHGAAPSMVQDRITAARGDTFVELLKWQVDQDNMLSFVDTSTWEVEMDTPSVVNRAILRPVDIPEAPKSQTEAMRNALKASGVTMQCVSADSACICAAMDLCSWMPKDSGDGHHCVSDDTMSMPAGVPCLHCNIQTHCPADAETLCTRALDACSCALSTGDCKWEPATSRCAPREAEFTSCDLCSRQDRCGPPRIEVITPPAGSVLGEPGGPPLELTFDRRINFFGVEGDFWFQCFVSFEMGSARRTLPIELLQLQGRVLRIFASGMPNYDAVRCRLNFRPGALRDDKGDEHGGMLTNAYYFTLGDTAVPELAEMLPSSEIDAPEFPVQIEMTFTEPVRMSSSFRAELVLRSEAAEDQLLAEYDGPLDEAVDVNGTVLTLDTSSVADSGLAGSMYAVLIPSGSIVDLAGNAYGRSAETIHTFRVSVLASPFTIRFRLTVKNVDFEMLNASSDLTKAVKNAIREVVAEEAGPLVGFDNVDVELSAGSVVAQVTVAAADSTAAEAVRARLAASATLWEALLARLATLPGIREVSTGAVGLDDISAPTVQVTSRRGISTASATPATTLPGHCRAIWVCFLFGLLEFVSAAAF